jgi:chromate transporter
MPFGPARPLALADLRSYFCAMSQPCSASAPPRPTLRDLFLGFALISLCGFGGVLAWSRRILVEERRWMSADEFNDAYALCQFLPGPNVVNLSVVFGRRIRGVVGALIALVGLLAPPFIIVLLISLLYSRFGESGALQRALLGMAAAAAGLVMGTCAKMAKPLLRDRLALGPLIALATFVSIGVVRWPLYWALAVLVPVSIALAWVRR